MVSYLVKRNGVYMCHNCRVTHHVPVPYCSFCGKEFSNYEEMAYDYFKNQENEDLIFD